MLVMQDPIKTSSILDPAYSLNKAEASGSLGKAKMGSVISSKAMSMTSAYSAFSSASMSVGLANHSSIRAIRRSKVRASPYPSAIIHFNMTTLERKYSSMGSLSNLIVHPAADRSALASLNSKACSHFKVGKPSISKIRPEKTFFLPSLETVNKPFWMATYGMAWTKSRSVIPGCISPLKRTKTDSGISKGMIPVAAAKATNPDPAGKEIPIGKRVWESPPVPTVSGNNIRFNQE
mmetsp:Transcript_2179/g.3049  ORF Transcript_2179/g.3049 Transcript_2179/m.3049 type:complete len:235 (-) Transcript_2179:1116-1820(-)